MVRRSFFVRLFLVCDFRISLKVRRILPRRPIANDGSKAESIPHRQPLRPPQLSPQKAPIITPVSGPSLADGVPYRQNAMKLTLAALSMISIAINTPIALRRINTPINPMANDAAAKYKNQVRGICWVMASGGLAHLGLKRGILWELRIGLPMAWPIPPRPLPHPHCHIVPVPPHPPGPLSIAGQQARTEQHNASSSRDQPSASSIKSPGPARSWSWHQPEIQAEPPIVSRAHGN